MDARIPLFIMLGTIIGVVIAHIFAEGRSKKVDHSTQTLDSAKIIQALVRKDQKCHKSEN